jgi:hypothetical protein
LFNAPNRNASFHISTLARKNKELLIGNKNGNYAKIAANREFKLERIARISNPSLVEYDSISDNTITFMDNEIRVNNVKVIEAYATKFSEPTPKGNVFVSSVSAFYDIMKDNYSLFPKRVQDVSVWKSDTLIATPSGVFKKNKDTIEELSQVSNLLGYRSDDIDVSQKGDCFYIATQGAGVVVYGTKIYNISKNEGLSSNIVNEIHVENDSVIWACTNKGLNRIVIKDDYYNVTSIDKSDGLLSNEVEDVEIINDTLWVGTKEGLTYMPKKVLDTKPLVDIFLKIKEVKVNEVIYPTNEQLELSYDQNKISFLVQGISFAKNANLEYQYRLKETDSKWSRTKNRTISFPNLKYGNYTFQVKACIGERCYTEKQLEYHFVIKPPFWKSGWFYALCFIGFGALIYLFFRIRVLTYNKDVTRELIRLLIKRIKRDEKYLRIRTNGTDVKIPTSEILYIKSSGNYLDIISTDKTYTIRCKIGDFIASTPDALEYLRVHRSYIIRIDKVTGKAKNSVTIKEQSIPVGETYLSQLDNIHF